MATLQIGAGYLYEAVYAHEEVIHRAKRTLAKVKFDSIVGRGMSGALVVPKLADALGVAWGVVRKPGDGTHSMNKDMEGCLGTRWVFVDDLVSSGRTFRESCMAVDRVMLEHRYWTELVGCYLYCDDVFREMKWDRVGQYLTRALPDGGEDELYQFQQFELALPEPDELAL